MKYESISQPPFLPITGFLLRSNGHTIPRWSWALLLPVLVVLLAPLASAADRGRPNVLFIIVDDLNDWVGHLGGHPQAKTPHIDRLASQGVSFSRAFCPSPVCNPSRTAVLTGLRAGTSGVYDNTHDWRKRIPVAQTLPATFRQAGYRMFGTGKIFHSLFNEIEGVWHESRPFNSKDPEPAAGVSLGVEGIRFAPLDVADEAMQDYQSVSWAVERLARQQSGPFFLACGLYRPHMPMNVPRKYFDLHPLEKIILPKVLESDADDLPTTGKFYARNSTSHGSAAKTPDHELILESGRWKEAVQAYLAAVSFADTQVGRLLDALERSPHRDNTLVVLWGDNGFHLGQKLHWRKVTLWREAGRVPLIWKVPGVTRPGTVSGRTVDLMAIYPTLTELCGIATPKHLEGVSIKPLLANPDAPWSRPAITTARRNDHTVRSEQWRYIRYHDGGEELYRESDDPYEWRNLADQPEFAPIKAEHSRWLPKVNRETPPPDVPPQSS